MVRWNPFQKDKIYTETVSENQKCVIEITPLTDLPDSCQQCANATTICHNHPEYYDQVFISDDVLFYEWALKKVPFFRFWKFVYLYFRFFIDEVVAILTTWHFAFYFDEFIKKNKTIYVKDTLSLHCKSSGNIDKIIPYITGSYSRLILSGEITFNHVKLLWHDKLEKIYVAKPLELKSEEYDDFVEFSLKHSRSFDSLFIYFISADHPELKEKLTKVFENNKTHNFYVYSCDKPYVKHWWVFVHKGCTRYFRNAFSGWFLIYFILNVTLFFIFWDQMPYLIIYMLPILLANPFWYIFFRVSAIPPGKK